MTQKEISLASKFVKFTLFKNKKWKDFVCQLCDIEDLIQESLIAIWKAENQGYKLNAGFIKCLARNAMVNYTGRKCRWFTKVPRDKEHKNQYKVIIPTKVGYLRCLLTRDDSVYYPEKLREETEIQSEQLAFIGTGHTYFNPSKRREIREMFWVLRS